MEPTIIVTGAGSGIGRATARSFLNAGWQVGLMGRRVPALEESAAGSDRAVILPCNVSDAAQIKDAFSQVRHRWGRLDALFNNAGVSLAGAPIDEIDINAWRNLMDVNVTGFFLAARAAFRMMRKQIPQGGRIINNGSISAHVPRPGSAAYTTSKHAITGLTRSISLDGRAFGIACGQIDIGNAQTDMTDAMPGGIRQADGSCKPEPLMEVEHVAKAVLHMASLPLTANVLFMTVMATTMPYVGRG